MTERRPIIAANWKMHKTHLEAIQAVQKLSYLLDKDDAERVEVVICPPFTALRSVADPDRLRQAAVRARRAERLPGGEGRVHRRGVAGRCSPRCRVGYVIVGHSERRQLFGEDDEIVNKKVRAVFAHGMTPILCVGETLEERDAGGTEIEGGAADPARRSTASTPSRRRRPSSRTSRSGRSARAATPSPPTPAGSSR